MIGTAYSGNTVTVTDQAGKQRKSITDGLGRLIQVYEAPNDSNYNYLTSYSYNALDDLTGVSQVDPVTQYSQTRSFIYDSLKRLSSATNPESGTTSYQYDDNGNLLVKTDARSVSAHYSYDALNRTSRRWYNGSSSLAATTNNNPALPSGVDASDEVNYAYDSTTIANGKGRLVSVSSNVSSYSYSGYDALGRALGGTQTIGSQNYLVGYTYNQAGHVLTQTYPSGRTVTNTYDNAGRLNTFTGNLGDGATRTYSTGISYDNANHWAREQFGTATPLYNKRHYNNRGQLYDMRLSTVNDDSNWNRGAIINYYSLANYGFGATGSDTNGNLYVQQHWVPTDDQISGYTVHQQNYSYDSLNRIGWMAEYLNGATGTGSQSFSYDRYGNRTINSGWGTGTSNQAFSADTNTNRLGVPSGQSGAMSYDSAGNLINDTYSGEGQRTYDAENRMKQAWANSQWQTYTYDGDGHRVKRNVNGTETWQVYGMGGELLAEYAANTAASTPQKEYGYRNGELLITATSASSGQGCGVGYSGTKTWSATSGSLGHVVGHAEGSDWAVYAGSDSSNYMSYGPYDTSFGQGHHTAQFTLMVDNTSGTDVVANLDVVTGFGANVLAQRQIHRNEFAAANQWQVFTLEFDNPCFGYLEARVYWYGTVNMKFHQLAVSSVSSGAVDIEWLVTDQLGTPRMIADQTGSLANVKRHDYLPFGEELYAGVSNRTAQQGYTGDSVRQKFTQKERDNETGLDYFSARYYASTQGRFTSPDPLLSSARSLQPQSWNKYSYVINRPLNLIDPNGLDWGQWDDGNGNLHYWYFSGKVGSHNGHTYTAVQGLANGGSRLVPDESGELFRIRNNSNLYLEDLGRWKAAPVINPAQDQVNQLAGFLHGVGRAVTSANPIAQPLVDAGIHKIIGGVDESDPGYHNASAIGTGLVAGALLAAPGAEAETVLNLGGEGEVPGALNVQGNWTLDADWLGSNGKSLGELQQAGHQFAVADNTALPFANQSVDRVITNSVPIDKSTWLGPGVQSSEVWRVLKDAGTWINNGKVVPRP